MVQQTSYSRSVQSKIQGRMVLENLSRHHMDNGLSGVMLIHLLTSNVSWYNQFIQVCEKALSQKFQQNNVAIRNITVTSLTRQNIKGSEAGNLIVQYVVLMETNQNVFLPELNPIRKRNTELLSGVPGGFRGSVSPRNSNVSGKFLFHAFLS